MHVRARVKYHHYSTTSALFFTFILFITILFNWYY